MVHRALKGCNIVAIGSYNDDFKPEKVKTWVELASGKISFQSRITNQTTHLVVSDKKWKEQGAVVKDALERKDDGQKIHIVAWEWLDESIRAKSRRAERTYSWLKKARMSAKSKDPKEPRSAAGLMSQVFTESTDAYLSETAKKQIEKRHRLEQEARDDEAKRKQEVVDSQREQMNIKALVEFFKRGIQKSRNQLLTDKYHVYVDEMGFTYNATVAPVTESDHPDGQYTVQLQIYESKASSSEHDQMNTYACNSKYSGTKKLPERNVVLCIGCNFLTAFRSFKKAFKEMTGVAWDSGFIGTEDAEFEYLPPAEDMAVESVETVGGPREKGKGRKRSPKQPSLNGSVKRAEKQAALSNGTSGQPIALDEEAKEADLNAQQLDLQTGGLEGVPENSDGAFSMSNSGNSALGKRKSSEDTPTDDEPPGKQSKTADYFTSMSQELASVNGSAYALGSVGGSGAQTFPRIMAGFQEPDGGDEGNEFFDFDMGETV